MNNHMNTSDKAKPAVSGGGRLRGKSVSMPASTAAPYKVAASTNAMAGAAPSSTVFGPGGNWVDQLAEDELLKQGLQGGISPLATVAGAAARLPAMATPANGAVSLGNSGAGARYTSAPTLHHPSSGSISKPPSPIDANGQSVKFVNSTVENLQNQIKKEEAPKKKRTRTSPEQLRILQKAFATDPMPSSSTRLALSKKLGMNARAVQVWFQNRRAKAKRAEAMGQTLNDHDDDDDDCNSQGTDIDPDHVMRHKPIGSHRAASMPMSYAPELNGFYDAQMGHSILGLDAAAFFDTMENGHQFESEFAPHGAMALDFATTMTGYGYGMAPSGASFSLPSMSSFPIPLQEHQVQTDAIASNSHSPNNVSRSYGYSAYQTTDMYVNDDLDLMNGEMSLLGSINPLSAMIDACNGFDGQAGLYTGEDLMNEYQPHQQQQSYSSAIPIPSFNRRSYSLNDIHSHLTLQQIQTLENIGLPSLSHHQQARISDHLGAIHEANELGQEDSKTLNQQEEAVAALLSTPIDDLRMSAFWDATGGLDPE